MSDAMPTHGRSFVPMRPPTRATAPNQPAPVTSSSSSIDTPCNSPLMLVAPLRLGLRRLRSFRFRRRIVRAEHVVPTVVDRVADGREVADDVEAVDGLLHVRLGRLVAFLDELGAFLDAFDDRLERNGSAVDELQS